MQNVEKPRDYIAEFRAAFTSGINGLVRAGQIYAEAIDADPANADRFRSADLNLPEHTWAQLEAIGRKQIHPKLLMGCNVRNLGKIKRLPYSVQDRIFAGLRFEFLTPGGTILVDARELSPEQAEQLIDGATLRTLSAQKVWLESRKPNLPETAEVLPYTIQGDHVIFRRSASLTRKEIKRLLEML